MSFTTIGSLILRLRREKKINRNKLASGLCSVQTLYEIESDQYDADLFMLEMMLQRLGKSEDKLEIVMTAEILTGWRTKTSFRDLQHRMNLIMVLFMLKNSHEKIKLVLQKGLCDTFTKEFTDEEILSVLTVK